MTVTRQKDVSTVVDTAPEAPVAPTRAHKATYAADKRKGGYLIRVEGPNAPKFLYREVPVTTRAGKEHLEKLEKLIWSGVDETSKKPVALYTFAAKPRDLVDDDICF